VQNGKPETLEAEFCCKGDQWSSEDAYMGKAERKLKRLCYERMTGLSFCDGDASEAQAPDVKVSKSPFEDELLDHQVQPAPEKKEANPPAPEKKKTAQKEIDPTKLPAAALPAAINQHKKAPYFAETLQQFDAKKATDLDEDQKRECLNNLLEAQEVTK